MSAGPPAASGQPAAGHPPDPPPGRGDAPPTTGRPQLARVLELTGLVFAPTSLLTAMLYYFGYSRERALYGYFGVDLGTVGLSTTDYLVRSAGVAFSSLAVLSMTTLAGITLYPVIMEFLIRSGTSIAIAVICGAGAAAAGLFVVALVGLLSPTKTVGPEILAPSALGSAALITAFTLTFAQRHLSMPPTLRKGLASAVIGRLAVLTALILIAMFWATADIGQQHGESTAHIIELTLAEQPQAVVYSRQRLQIRGPGVTVSPLDGRDAAYAYRYSGLRLLVHNAGKWLLLPAGWTSANRSTAVIIADTDTSVRVELGP